MAEESVLALGIQSLYQMGFFQILLPFMLVFAIVYGVLERSKFFGEDRHDINAVIAFVLGLMVVISSLVLQVLGDFLPLVGLFAVILVMFIMLVSMFWGEASNIWDNMYIRYGSLIVIAGVLIMILADLLGLGDLFLNITGGGDGKILGLFTMTDIFALAFILGMFGVIMYMTKTSKKGGE